MRTVCALTAGGADQRPGDLQHRLHQHVHAGDDPQADGLRLLRVPEEPLQHLRRHHRHHQVGGGRKRARADVFHVRLRASSARFRVTVTR